MMKTFSSPLAFKTSLETRLREEAKRRGRPMNRLRQVLVMDRFLVRIFQGIPNHVVLKGGLVLELRLERARSTKDIDLALRGDPSRCLTQLREAAALELGDFLGYEVDIDHRHPDIVGAGVQYEGHRYRVRASLAGKPYGDPFGVDAAFGDPFLGAPESVEGLDLLSFIGIQPCNFRVYPRVTHLAEKLHAYTLPREQTNMRFKDLPDIALLAGIGPIESTELQTALYQTFQHRATHPVPTHLPPPPTEWSALYERLAVLEDLPWKSLDLTYLSVQKFIDPVLTGIKGLWDPIQWRWT